MIYGAVETFALESGVSAFLPELGQMAIGFFNIHINGRRHGVYDMEASLLASSYFRVTERLQEKGEHVLPSNMGKSSLDFVRSFRYLHYGINTIGADSEILNNGCDVDRVFDNNLMWAPDGDEAFDDGSHVFQIDEKDNMVRLIAFNNSLDEAEFVDSITELYIESRRYYGVLEDWSTAFRTLWENSAKR